MANKIFYSHTEKKDGKRIPTKLLKCHTKEVTNIATDRLSNNAFTTEIANLKLNISIFNFLKQVAQLHDLGKFPIYFQNFILYGKKTDEKLHPLFGALAIANKLFKTNDNITALLGYYIIEHHHLDLRDFNCIRNIDESYTKIFKKQYENVVDDIPQIA